MKRWKQRGREGAREETDFFGDGDSRKAIRKSRQLCGQVQRAVSLALSGFDDELLRDLYVVKVEPADGASRLVIWVAGPEGSSIEEILARLNARAGVLRAEIASAIYRKQVPAISFAVSEAHSEGEP